MSASPEAVTGTIYDIGYRHYDGPRLGRRGAIGAIVGAGLRAVFGLGRSGRSKIIPWGAVMLAAHAGGRRGRHPRPGRRPRRAVQLRQLPVGHRRAARRSSSPRRRRSSSSTTSAIACCRSTSAGRSGRFDYVARQARRARRSASSRSRWLPVLVLFAGRVLAAEDVVGALGDEIGALPAIVGSGVIHAVVLASLGLAICSLAARRAYAAGAVLAVFLIGGVVSAHLQGEAGGGAARTWRRSSTRSPSSTGHASGSSAAASPSRRSRAVRRAALHVYGLATALLRARVAGRSSPFRYRRITT